MPPNGRKQKQAHVLAKVSARGGVPTSRTQHTRKGTFCGEFVSFWGGGFWCGGVSVGNVVAGVWRVSGCVAFAVAAATVAARVGGVVLVRVGAPLGALAVWVCWCLCATAPGGLVAVACSVE